MQRTLKVPSSLPRDKPAADPAFVRLMRRYRRVRAELALARLGDPLHRRAA